MQYRLSTIFLVFFVTAASLALMGTIGLWVAFVLCVAALAFNKAKTTVDGWIRIFYVILIGIVCPGVLIEDHPGAREAARRANCSNNLKQIGLALHNYQDFHHHFPAVNTYDKDGKPLYSWMVKTLPSMEFDYIYQQLHKDELWDSKHNAGILGKFVPAEFTCPSAERGKNDFSSNYVAIVGPGTIWRKEGAVSMKDLANPSLTVMAVECIDSDKHWAEPYALTAEEVLERMNTGKRMRIGSLHPAVILVLFADGNVHAFRADMPSSLWRKLLMGEIKNFEELDNWQENSSDRPSHPGEWPFLLSILAWVISVLMLFYRAWDSRPIAKKPEISAG